MKTYDWVVIGAGITGTALAYELVKIGFSVLLLEQDTKFQNATRYSYGGLAFWSGTTPLTRQLCDEGMTRYQILPSELNADIEFRELDLLLTIAKDTDPQTAAANYTHFAIPPQLLGVDQACEMEPFLNREAIAGALTVKHGHINPEKTAQAYMQAFLRAGGIIEITQVLELQAASAEKCTSVKTTTNTYHSDKIVVCAGGFSRQLLKASGIAIKLYFTHAEMIATPAVDLHLHTLVMPANLQRFQLEVASTKTDAVWDEAGTEVIAPILDAGAVQFQDRSLRLGQISRTLTDANAKVDAQASERWLRQSLGQVLPNLAKLPGTWHDCLVAFSSDGLPLIGAIDELEGIYVFSGFSNPLVIIPPLAQRFARWASGKEDEMISQLSPQRFS